MLDAEHDLPAQGPPIRQPPAAGPGGTFGVRDRYAGTDGTYAGTQGSHPEGSGDAYPGTQASPAPYEGAPGAYPAAQGTYAGYPSAQGAYTGAQGAYTGAQGAYPGSVERYGGQDDGYPGAPDPYAARDDLYARPAGRATPRGPLVVAVAFVVAIGLGVAIGLATATHHSKAKHPASAAPAVVDSQAAPVIPASSWGGNRQAGAERNVILPPGGKNRVALRYVYGQKYGQPVDAVDIPKGKLFYGVILGATAANDQYWAVGLVDVRGGPATLVVWNRTGTGPWQVNGRGPGACGPLPSAFSKVWDGPPPFC
jgi:hypothetical protein